MIGLTKDQEHLLEQLGELVAECIRIGIEQERERCVAEVRRIQKRNTNTTLDASQVWNAATETMGNECADAIANP